MEEMGVAVGDDELAGRGYVAPLDAPNGGIDLVFGHLNKVFLDTRRHLVVVLEHAHGGVDLGLQVVASGEGLIHQLYIAAPLRVAEFEGGATSAAFGLGDEGVTVHLEEKGCRKHGSSKAVGNPHRVYRHIRLFRHVDAQICLRLGLWHLAIAAGRQQYRRQNSYHYILDSH